MNEFDHFEGIEMPDDIPIMLTLKEASERTGLSYNFLRNLCLQKKIVYVKAGSKYLVNFRKLIDYLQGGDSQPEQTQNSVKREIGNNNFRTLTVSSGCDSKYCPLPFIRLQGMWLKDYGFDIGDKVLVQCQESRLVITKSREK